MIKLKNTPTGRSLAALGYSLDSRDRANPPSAIESDKRQVQETEQEERHATAEREKQAGEHRKNEPAKPKEGLAKVFDRL